MAKTLVITSGSIAKSKKRGPPKSVYKGPLFRQKVLLCESKDFELKIISLKFCLIDSSTVIQPYDQMSLDRLDQKQFRNKIVNEIEQLILKYDKIIFIAGKFYRHLLGSILENKKFDVIHARNYGGFRAKIKEMQTEGSGMLLAS